jgi:hypothetical protein
MDLRIIFSVVKKPFFVFFWVKILLFDADPGSGMETVRIREKSRILDKHPGSATLLEAVDWSLELVS